MVKTSIIKKWKNKVITMATGLIERVDMAFSDLVRLNDIIPNIRAILEQTGEGLKLKQTIFLQDDCGKVSQRFEKGNLLTYNEYSRMRIAYEARNLYS